MTLANRPSDPSKISHAARCFVRDNFEMEHLVTTIQEAMQEVAGKLTMVTLRDVVKTVKFTNEQAAREYAAQVNGKIASRFIHPERRISWT